MPVPLPNNTRAIIVQVYYNFWNQDGHAYLDVDIQQEGNKDGGVASVENTHYRVYANTFYYEVMVPWDSYISDKIQFTVKRSYLSGGSDNWYRLVHSCLDFRDFGIHNLGMVLRACLKMIRKLNLKDGIFDSTEFQQEFQ